VAVVDLGVAVAVAVAVVAVAVVAAAAADGVGLPLLFFLFFLPLAFGLLIPLPALTVLDDSSSSRAKCCFNFEDRTRRGDPITNERTNS